MIVMIKLVLGCFQEQFLAFYFVSIKAQFQPWFVNHIVQVTESVQKDILSYIKFLVFVKVIFGHLALSYSWKFISTTSFSQIILLNSLYISTACRYWHIFIWVALSAILWISLCVLKIVTPGVHSFSAFADAYLIHLSLFCIINMKMTLL